MYCLTTSFNFASPNINNVQNSLICITIILSHSISFYFTYYFQVEHKDFFFPYIQQQKNLPKHTNSPIIYTNIHLYYSHYKFGLEGLKFFIVICQFFLKPNREFRSSQSEFSTCFFIFLKFLKNIF